MRHDAHGYWIEEAGLEDADGGPPLSADTDADVVVIGGGYTGLWSAWWLKQHEPDARVVLLEADRCGFGPSGRNGGFVNSMSFSLPTMRALFGDERGARDGPRAATPRCTAIGDWCEAAGGRRLVHATAATCRPRPRRTSTAPGIPSPPPASELGRARPGRGPRPRRHRSAAAPHRCSAPPPSTAPAPPSSRPASPPGCASACSRPGSRSTRTRRSESLTEQGGGVVATTPGGSGHGRRGDPRRRAARCCGSGRCAAR